MCFFCFFFSTFWWIKLINVKQVIQVCRNSSSLILVSLYITSTQAWFFYWSRQPTGWSGKQNGHVSERRHVIWWLNVTSHGQQHRSTLCLGKRDQNVFLISSIKVGRFRLNLVHSFLNKFVAKSFKRFPPHLNKVSILHCDTWNAHRTRATNALSAKVTLNFIPSPQLWPLNSPDLSQIDYGVWKYCKRCTKHASLIWTYWRRHALTNGCRNDMIQLGHSVLSRCLNFQFVQISEYFEHLHLQYFQHSVINWIQSCRV